MSLQWKSCFAAWGRHCATFFVETPPVLRCGALVKGMLRQTKLWRWERSSDKGRPKASPLCSWELSSQADQVACYSFGYVCNPIVVKRLSFMLSSQGQLLWSQDLGTMHAVVLEGIHPEKIQILYRRYGNWLPPASERPRREMVSTLKEHNGRVNDVRRISCPKPLP